VRAVYLNRIILLSATGEREFITGMAALITTTSRQKIKLFSPLRKKLKRGDFVRRKIVLQLHHVLRLVEERDAIMKRFLYLLLLSFSVSCASNSAQNNNQSAAKPSPSVAANQNNASDVPFLKEDEDELAEDSDGTRQEARQKAIEYAQQNFPGWHVKGIISRRTFDKHYQITLDLEKGSQTKTVQLLLRRFFPEKDEPYWKVEPFVSQNLSRQYQELAYLRFVEGQEYNYDGCRDLVLDNLEVDDVPDSVREAIIESYQEAASDDRDYEPYDPRN
jgi:hypothetical protein